MMIQGDLPLARAPETAEVSMETIMRRKDFLGAINLCVELSGLDDKEIYLELKIDPGQWSRMRHGDAHFPPNKLQSLMAVCGNRVPLIWLARSYGYELVQIESETQRQLRIEREARIEAERKLAYAESLLKGK